MVDARRVVFTPFFCAVAICSSCSIIKAAEISGPAVIVDRLLNALDKIPRHKDVA
jgi:hypothetical protein